MKHTAYGHPTQPQTQTQTQSHLITSQYIQKHTIIRLETVAFCQAE